MLTRGSRPGLDSTCLWAVLLLRVYLESDPHFSVDVTNFDSQVSVLSDPFLPFGLICIHLYDEMGEVS